MTAALCDAVRCQLTNEAVAVPAAGQHVWEWFWDLDRGRGGNGWSLNVLSWSEIDAWRRTYRIRRLAPWEADALRAMDTVSLVARHRKDKQPGEPDVLWTEPQDIKAALFRQAPRGIKIYRGGVEQK